MKKSVILSLSALFISGLFFYLGYLLGTQKKTTFVNENLIYAEYSGGQVRASEVLEKIKNDLFFIEKNSYDLKKRTAQDIILQRLSPSDLINTSQPENRQAVLDSAQIKWTIPFRFLNEAVMIEKGFLAAIGSESAKNRIIVFGNYHCPYCMETFRKIKTLSDKYGSEVVIYYRFYYREDENSFVSKALNAAACANEQGKFWDYSAYFMNPNQQNLDDYENAAKVTELNLKQFNECLVDLKYQNLIQKDKAVAESLKMERPPLIVVNGQVFYAHESLENLELALK